MSRDPILIYLSAVIVLHPSSQADATKSNLYCLIYFSIFSAIKIITEDSILTNLRPVAAVAAGKIAVWSSGSPRMVDV